MVRFTAGQLSTALLIVAFANGCATAPNSSDGENDSFLGPDGKADTGGIVDGSVEAFAVLRVANQSTLDALTEHAGLVSRAAHAIVAYRIGDDGVAGTSDDAAFHSLEDLDAVPYVGPIAFHDLLGYAESLGYTSATSTDPFSANPTGQPIATFNQMWGLLPAGASSGKIGHYSMYEQHRSCNAVSCSPWRNTTSLELITYNGNVAYPDLPLVGDVYLLAESTPYSRMYLVLEGKPRADGLRLRTWCFVGPSDSDYLTPILRARGLGECSTAVKTADVIGIPPYQNAALLEISEAGLFPIDWYGRAATDQGYVTPYDLKLEANQKPDDDAETARMAITASFD